MGEQLALPFPSTSEILSATSATRSRAYEVPSEILHERMLASRHL